VGLGFTMGLGKGGSAVGDFVCIFQVLLDLDRPPDYLYRFGGLSELIEVN